VKWWKYVFLFDKIQSESAQRIVLQIAYPDHLSVFLIAQVKILSAALLCLCILICILKKHSVCWVWLFLERFTRKKNKLKGKK